MATFETKTESKTKNPHAVMLGRLGGLKRAQVLLPNRRKEIALKAILTRWRKDKEVRVKFDN